MNTFGTSLPNYSLLHTHGFIDSNNPVDKVCSNLFLSLSLILPLSLSLSFFSLY